MKIQVFKGSKLIKEYEITKDSFTLGRSDDCEVTVLEDGIARKHIEFRKKDGSVLFAKKSKFGILSQNGNPVSDGEMRNGDRIEIGEVSVSLVVEEALDDMTSSNTQEIPVPEEIPVSEPDEGETPGKAGKDKKKEDGKPAKKGKGASDFEFFTMTASPEDLGRKDKKRPEADEAPASSDEIKKEAKKEKEEEGDKGTRVKDQARSKQKDEATVQGRSGKPGASYTESADATMVGPAYLLYQLIAISGPYKDKVFSLEKDVIIAGRSKSVGIVLVDDLVSREHARFYRQGVDYYLIDLNSANGTKINGKKVLEPVLLVSGDIIEIGSSTLRFMVVNPQVQNAQGVDLGVEDARGRSAVEKVAPVLSEGEIRKIERSFGVESKEPRKKKKLLPIIFGAVILLALVMFLLPGKKKEEPKQPPQAVQPEQAPAEAVPEETAEIQCTETGSFCQLPPGVQKQLLAEYEVGVKLFKNFQFELAEDRAQQILSRVPDWPKARELLELAADAKEKLIAQKQEEEESQIRKMLQEKLAGLVREAQDLMRQSKYEKVKEVVSKIFEIDPNNEEAKKLVDQIEEIFAQRERAAQKRAEFAAALSRYKNALDDGKKLYARKEYMKAVEAFQKCLSLPPLDSSDARNTREECRRLLDDSNRLLRESITPELTVAEELFTSGQFREAIASYQRVLKIDYKNKTAKARIAEARQAINEDAKENYARAAIAESVSDYKNACLLYYKVIQIAIPGSKYYNDAMAKTKKLCNKDRSSDIN